MENLRKIHDFWVCKSASNWSGMIFIKTQILSTYLRREHLVDANLQRNLEKYCEFYFF